MSHPDQQAFVFRFFSLSFAYPNEAFLPALKRTAQNISSNASLFYDLTASFEQEEPEQLQAEYTRLFINGYPHTPCPPYESVYLEKRMLGQASIEVQALYQEWDMTVEAGLTDHIATEFEFLSFLASAGRLKSVAKAAGDASERFIKEHLNRWLPQFIVDLKTAAHLQPYKQLANLLEHAFPQCPVQNPPT